MSKRILIVGAGEVGLNTARLLSLFNSNYDITVMDHDAERLDGLSEFCDVQTYRGSATSPQDLEEINISEMDALFVVTDSDEVNITTCMIAKKIGNPSMQRFARIRNQELYDYIPPGFVRPEYMINPEAMCTERALDVIRHPQLVDFLPFENGRVRMIGIKVTDQCRIAGKGLYEFTHNQNLTIAAIRSHLQDEWLIPLADYQVDVGDVIYTVVDDQSEKEVYDLLFSETKINTAKVIISGINLISTMIIDNLLAEGHSVMVLDSDVKKTNAYEKENGHHRDLEVIRGNFSDHRFDAQQHIPTADLIIACSDDDEENLVSALLAKRLGCTRIVVICNSHRYQSIIRELGFEVALSPRQLAANHLVHLIHKGKFLATQNLSTRDQIEVQEFRVPQHHHSVYLRELKNQPFWPDQDTLIAAILREDQMLRPGGNQTLQPNDRVLVVARHECFERLQSYFETNLE